MTGLVNAEFNGLIEIEDFEKSLPSWTAGTFGIVYLECENGPANTAFIVELYPNGITHANRGYVSVKISSTFLCESNMAVTLSVVDSEKKQLFFQSATCKNGYHRINCLFENFIKHGTLMHQKETVLPGDVLSIQCDINYSYEEGISPGNFIQYDDNVTYDYNIINFQLPHCAPYNMALPANGIRHMHKELIREAGENTVKLDDVDKDSLLEFIASLCSNTPSSLEEDVYTVHDPDSDRVGCTKYAAKIETMVEHAPGLLGLAYLHKDQQLRCTVKQLIRHHVLQIVNNLRHIYIYSVPEPMQSSSTLMIEYLTFQNQNEVSKLHDTFDVLKLYVTAYKYQNDGLKEYCAAYLFRQMDIKHLIFILMLASDYNHAKLKVSVVNEIRRNIDAVTGLPEWGSLSRNQPDLVEKILSETSNDNPRNGKARETILSYIENARRVLLKESLEFYK